MSGGHGDRGSLLGLTGPTHPRAFHQSLMIATIMFLEGRPVVPLPPSALDQVHPGQRVRITMQPLTPCLESDDSPA